MTRFRLTIKGDRAIALRAVIEHLGYDTAHTFGFTLAKGQTVIDVDSTPEKVGRWLLMDSATESLLLYYSASWFPPIASWVRDDSLIST